MRDELSIMCGRFALKTPPAELIRRFGLDECADSGPRYNIPPGIDVPVIRQSPEGKRFLHLLRWGLLPHWAKDPSWNWQRHMRHRRADCGQHLGLHHRRSRHATMVQQEIAILGRLPRQGEGGYCIPSFCGCP